MTGQVATERLEALGELEQPETLERMCCLLEKLKHPEQGLKFVHLGGTNGKGSVSAMLYAIFNRCDYKAGLFTAPHLYSVRERVQVGGVNISEADLGALSEEVFVACEGMVSEGMGHPTLFECTLAIALLYFKAERVDVALIEAGKDGKFDPTNVIGVPVVSVLTNMDHEWHSDFRESLAEIALDKASIVKEGSAVCLYHQDKEVVEAVMGLCEEIAVPLVVSRADDVKLVTQTPKGQKLSIHGKIAHLSLVGEHQRHNLALALDVVHMLKERGFGFSSGGVMAGFARIICPGRFEHVLDSPDFVLDGCHNVQGVKAVVKTLEEVYPNRSVVFLVGVLEDKEHEEMISQVLSVAKQFVTVTPRHPHGLSGGKLLQSIKKLTDLPVVSAENVTLGVQTAMELCESDDLICGIGSLHIVGDIRNMLGLC